MKPNKLTPRTVITSNKAKENIVNARSTMMEMNASMAMHKSNIDRQNMQVESQQREIDKNTMQNQHEITMQQQKLNAINGII